MKVSEKSLELNVGAELLMLLRGPWGMPKAYLRGLTQREEDQEGVDFYAHLGAGARMLAFQFKAPRRGPDREPYRYTLARDQHELLHGLAQLAPDSVYYVFPFYVAPPKLQRDVPNLAMDTWLLPVAPMDPVAVFAAQKTKVIRCHRGTASVNPTYQLAVLSKELGRTMRGIAAAEFGRWYASHRRFLAIEAQRRNPWLVRGLRIAVLGTEAAEGTA